MQDDHAIRELLNAKEGEQVQFKEAKVDLILPRQPAFVALCQIAAAGNLYLEYRTNVPARL